MTTHTDDVELRRSTTDAWADITQSLRHVRTILASLKAASVVEYVDECVYQYLIMIATFTKDAFQITHKA